MVVRAIYGGSFDPPHIGHAMAACWVLSTCRVDELVIVPTWKHPFDKQHGAGFTHRVEMCQRAFASIPGVVVSTIEQDIGTVSRTLHTLEAFAEMHSEDELRLVVGADVLTEVDKWYRWDDIAALAAPIAVGRAGYPLPADCPIEIPNVSSTEVRRRLGRGESVVGLVPHAVIDYVAHHSLYEG